ncbi:GSCFA domain-containing protein [Albibacillus kandeliae]|uniref:GSCFA domain-containing protein n=1 Tax=Albibacillus kandeliae TaxID=2174228 RepID=UPI0013006247|nr:GSCFA domain-containing protein [Albibacillus kandeliae]
MPYRDLPPQSFWKSCRDGDGFRLGDIYAPRFALSAGDRVATAGSCFAQNISQELRRSELTFVDTEPAPRGMLPGVARAFGYGLFSARYGNIYTARQMRQLLDDAIDGRVHDTAIWESEGRFYDALRPGVEPEGMDSPDEVVAHRLSHLAAVASVVASMDVFVLTLGLTESWIDRDSGLVFPSAPGVIAGAYDSTAHGFVNFGFAEVMDDLRAVIAVLRMVRADLRVILTVSPVPLTATATGGHVLSATTYSKSVLRAVAGELAATDPLVDYFPSYEIVAGLPFGPANYQKNLRNVSDAAVARVMDLFFAAHDLSREASDETDRPIREEEACEEALLEAFAAQ